MATSITRDELENYVGFKAEPTEWFTVDQQRIDQFADVTLDHQFIHVDRERAAQTPFGGTIAHGFLTLSMLSYFAEQFSLWVDGTMMGVNYGLDKVRFLAPVKEGSRIRALATVSEIREKNPGQYLIRYEVQIEIEGGETPALAADWLALLFVQ